MKNWKKYVTLVCALVLCLCLAACGGGEDTPPDTIENLAMNASVEYDYSNFMGTWQGEDQSVLVMENEEALYHSERFTLYDAEGDFLASGNLQYVEQYDAVYAYNEHDGIAHRCWYDNDGTLNIATFGVFSKVSGNVPGETIGDLDIAEDEQLPDLSGFTGCWKLEGEPFYFVINDACEWIAINLYGEQVGPGYVVAAEDSITLCMEDGSELLSLWQTAYGDLSDASGKTLTPSEYIMLLPTPDDALNQTAYFPDGFANVSIDYPIQMTANPHLNVRNALSFNAVMEDGTDDYYSNILISFEPIEGFDPYMENGAATAKTYMLEMLRQIMNNMYGKYLLKSFGSDFKDNGDYYSLTGYMWLDGSIFADGPSQPVRGCMEVRYYGPTGYALVATTVALESRIRNYFDICNNMLTTISYTGGWSTAPKPRPAQPAYSGDSGDYGTPYYWYDEDGDIWYWNGYENELIGYGSNGYIDDDSGEYMESNDAGWDYDDYYDDYDPWSDPGDGDDAWSDPGDYYDDGWGDYFG